MIEDEIGMYVNDDGKRNLSVNNDGEMIGNEMVM
jgi:hypothetical protein